MKHKNQEGEKELAFLAQLSQVSGRRTFLKWGGITMAVAVAGCKADSLVQPLSRGGVSNGAAADPVDLGSGDVGILNYAYALEQLEAAFYIQVIANRYTGMTDAEFQILDDIRKHEIIHRNFLRDALGAAAIPALEVDFTSINFSSRASVLGAAKTFEDTGVSAYNGAGRLLKNLDYLVVAGKIVSVEARHAAAIRDLLNPKSMDFAGNDVVDPATGLDIVRSPAQVLPLVVPFIKTPINASNLPSA